MTNHWIAQHQPTAATRPWRFARKLDLFTLVPERRSAEAMDDERAAEQLIDDLIALVDAGLIAPVKAEGHVSYAPTDPDDLGDS
jgi:hypothetical protein